jgi:NADH-quinone oxidoreductase subunit M
VDLGRFNGLQEHTPTLAGLFLLTGLASIGFPGTIGFVGVELLVEGAVDVYPLVGIAVVVAAALNGIAILQAYFRIFTGTRHTASISMRTKLSERVAVLVLTLLILGGGLVPQPGVHSRHHAAKALLELRSGATADRLADATPASDFFSGLDKLEQTEGDQEFAITQLAEPPPESLGKTCPPVADSSS